MNKKISYLLYIFFNLLFSPACLPLRLTVNLPLIPTHNPQSQHRQTLLVYRLTAHVERQCRPLSLLLVNSRKRRTPLTLSDERRVRLCHQFERRFVHRAQCAKTQRRCETRWPDCGRTRCSGRSALGGGCCCCRRLRHHGRITMPEEGVEECRRRKSASRRRRTADGHQRMRSFVAVSQLMIA